MTRNELRALAAELESNLYAPHKRAAAVLCQIAEAQPEQWAVELRWMNHSKDGGWRWYDTYTTAEGARLTAIRVAGPGDIEARVVPLYRLPLED